MKMEEKTKILHSDNSRTILFATMTDDGRNVPGGRIKQFLAAIIVNLSAAVMGLSLTWSSPALLILEKPDSIMKITKEQASWIASLLTVGAFIGAIPAGFIANCIGRKRTLQVLAIPLLVSWIIIAFSTNVSGLYVARFILGIGIGAVCVVAPMYVSEISHISIRGTLGTIFQLQITYGLLVEYILGETLADFKWLALASAILPVVFLLSITFMPETPIYLYSKGDIKKARNSLVYFRGDGYDFSGELASICGDIKSTTRDNKTKISDLISSRSTLIALIISLGLMSFQQLSGINAVLFYAGNIFEESGNSLSPGICSILVGCLLLVATMISTILIDKAGRKILLLISASVMSICLITLGIYFHVDQYQDLSHISIVPLICLAVFVAVFSIGFGPIPWIMVSEIFPSKTKAIASSLSAATNWMMAFVVTKLFPSMNETLGTGITFIVFGSFCVTATIFVACLVPETKGKTITEIEEIILKKKGQNRNEQI